MQAYKAIPLSVIIVQMGKSTCKQPDCEKFPNYGYADWKRHWCKEHANSDMVYLAKKPGTKFKSDTCLFDGCDISSSFGLVGGKEQYCAKHKLVDMINLKATRTKPCREPGCSVKSPNFGLVDGQPTHCSKHKKVDMIDLRHATCSETGCKTQPNYNLPGEKPAYCKRHKQPGMIDVKNPVCEIDDCTKQPAFGLKDDKTPSRCLEHKTKDMIDIRNPICGSCGLSQVKSRTSLCAYCDPESKLRDRTKENAVAKLLEQHMPDVAFVQNRSSSAIRACGDRSFRPDFVLELDTHVLMLEIDEQQHSSYESLCEISRLISLGMAGEGMPVVIIRFNPDGFKIDGLNQDVSMDRRNEKLLGTLEHHIKTMPSDLLTVEYMFYTDDREKSLTDELQKVMQNYR